MKIITVENISKQFKTPKKFPGFIGAIKSLFTREYTIKNAVQNISFDIEEGEIVGYLGANGAGKSTTIKMMTGILTPTEGKITINGIVPYEQKKQYQILPDSKKPSESHLPGKSLSLWYEYTQSWGSLL